MNSASDWVRTTVVGALMGAVFWAVSAYAVMAAEGAATVYAAIAVVGLIMIVSGAGLYRMHESAKRPAAISLILAPLTGAAPLAVFLVVALPFQWLAG